MKIGILLVLSLLLAVGPAAPQALDDALIVPGERIGKWTLQMTIDDLVRCNGPARSAFFTKGHAPGGGEGSAAWTGSIVLQLSIVGAVVGAILVRGS